MSIRTFHHNGIKETINFLVLFVIKTVMKTYVQMADTEITITIEPSNLALIDDISAPATGDDSDANTAEHTELADIIRHALVKIKADQHKNF